MDTDLVVRAQRGDKGAYALVATEAARPFLAEDATQQALLAIWQDLPFVFTVGDDHGCQQAFFYNWPAIYGGPLWGETEPGDTIRVWIVDVDGVLLFIEGTTTTEASPALEEELQMFIDSIRFE